MLLNCFRTVSRRSMCQLWLFHIGGGISISSVDNNDKKRLHTISHTLRSHCQSRATLSKLLVVIVWHTEHAENEIQIIYCVNCLNGDTLCHTHTHIIIIIIIIFSSQLSPICSYISFNVTHKIIDPSSLIDTLICISSTSPIFDSWHHLPRPTARNLEHASTSHTAGPCANNYNVFQNPHCRPRLSSWTLPKMTPQQWVESSLRKTS